jgi:CRP-like cAMP-binding protein
MSEQGEAGRLRSHDPYNREAQTFPRLTSEQLARVERFGEVADYPIGTELFRRGERSVDFFVVVDGSVEIIDPGAPEDEQVIHTHQSASSPASSTCSTTARSS